MAKSIVTVGLILLPPLIFGFLKLPTEMGLSVIPAALAAAFLNIDKFTRLKAAGFEAELKQAVKEAYATTASLKALAEPLILSTLNIITMSGRWGGMSAREKHELKDQLVSMAKSMGLIESC